MQANAHLPKEIQSHIIAFIPHNEWHKVQSVSQLELGLTDSKLWKYLVLDNFAAFDNEDKQLVVKFGSTVRTFVWHTCPVHSSVNLHELFASFSNLVELDISSNTVLTDISALQTLSTLTDLNIRGLSSIGRLHLLAIFQSINSLRFLDISECTQLKETDIIRIARRNRYLEEIDFRESVSLNANTVLQVQGILIYLKEFRFCAVVHCNNSRIWLPIYMNYPQLQICPAAAEIILELNLDILQ